MFVSSTGFTGTTFDAEKRYWKHSKRSLSSIGEEFVITNYSTLSSVVLRVKVRYKREKYLLKEIESIKKKLVQSQKRTYTPFLVHAHAVRTPVNPLNSIASIVLEG